MATTGPVSPRYPGALGQRWNSKEQPLQASPPSSLCLLFAAVLLHTTSLGSEIRSESGAVSRSAWVDTCPSKTVQTTEGPASQDEWFLVSHCKEPLFKPSSYFIEILHCTIVTLPLNWVNYRKMTSLLQLLFPFLSFRLC